MVNIDRESVRKILVENLNMKKLCAKMVPKNLTVDRKNSIAKKFVLTP